MSVLSQMYDAELDRGYRWFNYPEFYSWLATQAREICEVGSWKGFSTVYLAQQLQHRHDGGRVYSVDVWDRKGAYWNDFCKRFPADSAGHLYACFLRHIERAAVTGLVLPHRLPSADAAKQFQRCGKLFDAVFIDGDHRYDAVRSDILNWRSRVRPGGILCGHDYNNKDVKRAVDELLPGVQVWQPGNVWHTPV